MKFCDLHTHSVFSDGTYTPAELIRSAVSLGLSALALTDHNTVDGLPDFLAAADGAPIEAIPGSEFSVDYEGKELHLLGLFIAPAHFGEISRLMTEYLRRKEESNIALVDALNKAGYALDYAAIKGNTPNGVVNRALIGAELTRLGYTESIQQAFSTLLSKKGGYYTEPKRPSVFDMIGFIRDIGAVPVLAHPFLNLPEDRLTAFLPEAKKAGLVGMECYYSKYSDDTTATSLRLAEKFGLKVSGGSDFHGDNKPDIALGCGRGNLQIPCSLVDPLRP